MLEFFMSGSFAILTFLVVAVGLVFREDQDTDYNMTLKIVTLLFIHSASKQIVGAFKKFLVMQ